MQTRKANLKNNDMSKKDLTLERLCSNTIFYVSCNKAFSPFVATVSFSLLNIELCLPKALTYATCFAKICP